MKTDLSIKAAIYLRAAELVEQGHCKWTLWQRNEANEKVAYCYVGAVIEAEKEITGAGEKDVRFATMITMERINWNNLPSTTKEMVVAKLRSQAFAEGA